MCALPFGEETFDFGSGHEPERAQEERKPRKAGGEILDLPLPDSLKTTIFLTVNFDRRDVNAHG